MNESTDLRAEDNKLSALVRLFKQESKAVTISGLALMAGILALLMAFMALSDAKEAKVRAEYQDQHIKTMQDQIATQQVYLDTHKHKEE